MTKNSVISIYFIVPIRGFVIGVAAQVFFVLAIDLVLLRDVGDGLKDGGVILTALRINVVGSYLGFCILLCRATGRPDGYLWCPDQSKAGP
jgi:hypothetical protein